MTFCVRPVEGSIDARALLWRFRPSFVRSADQPRRSDPESPAPSPAKTPPYLQRRTGFLRRLRLNTRPPWSDRRKNRCLPRKSFHVCAPNRRRYKHVSLWSYLFELWPRALRRRAIAVCSRCQFAKPQAAMPRAPESEQVASTPFAPSPKPPARIARAAAPETQAPIRGNPGSQRQIPIADSLDSLSLAASTDQQTVRKRYRDWMARSRKPRRRVSQAKPVLSDRPRGALFFPELCLLVGASVGLAMQFPRR